MRASKVEVRGCCMGIPFGCGTLMLFGLGLFLWQSPLSTFPLLSVLTGAAGVLVLTAAAFYTVGYFQEKRSICNVL